MSLEELRPNDLEGYKPDKLEYDFLTREVLTDNIADVDSVFPVKSSRLRISIPVMQGGRSSPGSVARSEEGYAGYTGTGTGSGQIERGENPMSPSEEDEMGRSEGGMRRLFDHNSLFSLPIDRITFSRNSRCYRRAF